MGVIKAVSIKQPWASLIVEGTKTIETRKWATKYRGPLLLVSSKQVDRYGPANCVRGPQPLGMALAVANLVDCRIMKRSDEEAACCQEYPGAYAWVLEDVKPIEPFPVKGQLSLYDVEIPDVLFLQG